MLLSEKERANIRHRLRIGNSVKVIALNYTGLKGIREEIEDIQAEMRREKLQTGRSVMRVPDVSQMPKLGSQRVVFEEGREGWYRALSPSLRMLTREVCHLHSISLVELLNGKDTQARAMFCNALRTRWAMSYPNIGKLVSCGPDTAKKLCLAWRGKSTITNPPMPKMPEDVMPVALAIAGEYGVTCYALFKGIRLGGLCAGAHNHFTYRLYAELGYTLEDIVRLLDCASKTGRNMLNAHVEDKALDRAEVERQHKHAAKLRYGAQIRPTIAAE